MSIAFSITHNFRAIHITGTYEGSYDSVEHLQIKLPSQTTFLRDVPDQGNAEEAIS